MKDDTVIALIVGALICALIGAAIGQRRGRPEAGFGLGFIMGPLGWLLVAVGPDLSAKPAADQVSAPVASSNTERLLELKKLLDAGVISQTDYDSKKQDILQQI